MLSAADRRLTDLGFSFAGGRPRSSGGLRDAEVAGSNPAFPTQKSLVRGYFGNGMKILIARSSRDGSSRGLR
jgi:hypothetical protein